MGQCTFMRRPLILLTTFLSVSLARAAPPDIVIMLADDMGYSDIGCYGGEVKTPVLEGSRPTVCALPGFTTRRVVVRRGPR